MSPSRLCLSPPLKASLARQAMSAASLRSFERLTGFRLFKTSLECPDDFHAKAILYHY